MQYQLEQWQYQAWEKAERRYWIILQQNLFGQWLVLCRWGVTDSKRGGQLERLCDSYEAGLHLVQSAEKRRKQRGYRRL